MSMLLMRFLSDKALKQQLDQDSNIQNLAVQLRDVLAYAEECRELKAIKGGTDTIREMGQLVVEGGSLIDECMRHGYLREFFFVVMTGRG